MAAWFSPAVLQAASPTAAERRGRPADPTRTAETPRLLLRSLPAPVLGVSLPGGRRLQVSPVAALMRVATLAVVLLAAWCAVRAPGLEAKTRPGVPGSAAIDFSTNEDAADPGGPLFDFAALVVVSTVTGGALSGFLDVTPLVGITWAAFAWANLTGTAFELTDGITRFTRTLVSRVGLMVILARAGLSLDVRSVRYDAIRAAALATLPLLAEATVHAAVSRAVVGGPWSWAFLRGFLAAAIAPSVVVPGVLKAKAARWGAPDSPADAMLAAVVAESAMAVWAVSFLVDLAVPSASGGRDTGLTAGLGPVQFICGPLTGVVIALAVAAAGRVLLVERGARADDGSGVHKRVGLTLSALLAAVSLTLIFAGARLELAGGGSLAAVAVAAATAHLLRTSGSCAEAQLLTHVQTRFASAWDSAVLPALFASLGSSVSATRAFGGAFLADYAPALVVGVVTRFAVAFVIGLAAPRLRDTPSADGGDGQAPDAPPATSRRRWCKEEALWVAVSWVGKASVQAAMGGVALVAALENQATLPAVAPGANTTAAQAEAAVQVGRADDLLALASLSAFVFAPVSALAMRMSGPALLGSAVEAADPANEAA